MRPLSQTVSLYVQLTRLDKPIGIYLLLWPTLWGLWLAGKGIPSLHVLVVFVLGTVLMRSAGCVINDFADRKVDKFVERTQNRPITSGKISSREALLLFVSLALIAFLLVLTLNTLTILMSFGGALLATIYPFMKRYTHLPQFFLGAAFGWAIPMAFAAETGAIPLGAWILFAITLVWAVIYDTMYAMVDREDDLKIGIRSTAILFGKQDRLIIGLFQFVMLGLLIWVGMLFELTWSFWMGLDLSAALMIYHQILIAKREKAKCFKAFLHNNWIGAVLFGGIFASFFVA